MGINDLVFVGRPVYSRSSGSWRGRRRRKEKIQPEEEIEQPSETATESEQGEEAEIISSDPTAKSTSRRHSSRKSPLTMFHVVFVLNPPALEHNIRVKEMYDNVVRKFSKVLRLEQAHDEYVWKQADIIQTTKAAQLAKRASISTLYSEVFAQSSLAVAISTIFKAISASAIAAVKLSPEVSISLQIPPVTSVSYLPSLIDPPIRPGVWLTTSRDSPSTTSDLDSATPSGAIQLAKQFALLLKESPQKILKEIQTMGGPLALPLSTFIDKARPTKSFYKIALANQISLADIQLLARHLIDWRRAIAVPPLHHRDVYIISPNADMSKLVESTKSFDNAFPMMPSLPRILSLLSHVPIPFGTLIPSADHKDEYYRVLAWLMRGGWVTQLRTFAHVRVSKGIKKAVREQDRGERNNKTQPSSPFKADTDPTHQTPSRRPSIFSHPSSETPHSVSTTTSTSHSQSQAQSQSQSQKSHTLLPPTTSASMANPHISSLILSPLRASALESKYLNAIAMSLTSTSSPSTNHESSASNSNNSNNDTTTPSPNVNDNNSAMSELEKAELNKYFPVLTKYFNGTEPLEMIPIRENLKRKFVWDILGRIGVTAGGSISSGSARGTTANGIAEGTRNGFGGSGLGQGDGPASGPGRGQGQGEGQGRAGGSEFINTLRPEAGREEDEAVIVTFRHW
jgi:hypothetical protein